MATRLRLLADQLKISIQERNRLLALEIEPSADDEDEIRHSLQTLIQGIQSLDGNGTEYRSDALQDEIVHLKTQYRELRALYGLEDGPPEQASWRDEQPRVPSPYRDQPEELPEELIPERMRKSVRFTDALIDSGASNGELLQMQTQRMREQDSSLDALSESIGRQRELSIQIGDELDEHGELLDNVGSMVDRSSDRLHQARSRLTTFSRKAKENSHLLTIVVLIIILVLLIALL